MPISAELVKEVLYDLDSNINMTLQRTPPEHPARFSFDLTRQDHVFDSNLGEKLDRKVVKATLGVIMHNHSWITKLVFTWNGMSMTLKDIGPKS